MAIMSNTIVRTTERVLAYRWTIKKPYDPLYLPKDTLLQIVNVIGPERKRTYDAVPWPRDPLNEIMVSVTPMLIEDIPPLVVLALAAL